ncbi:hypothetical protein KVR01_010687 [Diaporthe batatas]|uniref:uncharacterized protein n=1 Tax=Diaporthe batatas TaxID=748121 RepID=UPI001D0563D8|nr:uncharacterized protein KVR01_010687 [Diaporthe batatas]KAG8160050.1 hypothetical protein KVR01_010687 [Diaporthe batatas]
MAPHTAFPAHAEARLADANAAKLAEAKEHVHNTKEPDDDDEASTPLEGLILSGEVPGLNLSARQWILSSETRITIGHGSPQAFNPLVRNINLAMLEYYIPQIVANHAHNLPDRAVIILPENMAIITQRGLRYVVHNMKMEMEKGSYATGNPKEEHEEDEHEEATSMIRPGPNAVDMIHALNTLRAFGLSHDASFLAMEGGPITTSLQRRVLEWDGSDQALKRFLKTLSRLLAEEDQHLLAPAWAVYSERRRQAKSRPETSSPEA